MGLRLPLIFTAIADSIAGYMIGRGRHDFDLKHCALLAATSTGLYFFGVALYNLVDRNRKEESAPTGTLPSCRRLSRTWIGVAASLMLYLSLASNCFEDRFRSQRVIAWGLVVISVITFVFLKIPPILGAARAFNFLLGLSAALPIGFHSETKPWHCVVVAFPLFLYVTALTFVSSLEVAGPDNLKARIGVGFMIGAALLAAVVVPFAIVVEERDIYNLRKTLSRNWHGIVFATGLSAWMFFRARCVKDRNGTLLLVRDGMAGTILIDAGMVGCFHGFYPAILIAAFLIPTAVSIAIFKKLV